MLILKTLNIVHASLENRKTEEIFIHHSEIIIFNCLVYVSLTYIHIWYLRLQTTIDNIKLNKSNKESSAAC